MSANTYLAMSVLAKAKGEENDGVKLAISVCLDLALMVRKQSVTLFFYFFYTTYVKLTLHREQVNVSD